MIELLGNIFGVVKEFFGFAKQRDAELNSKKMQDNKEAAIDLKEHEKHVKEVLDGDINAIRNHPID